MSRWVSAGATQQESQRVPAPALPASTEGLELLVQGLFDYAGMFPPANFELDAALAEGARAPRLVRPHMLACDLVTGLDDLARLDDDRLRMAGFGDTEVKAAVVSVASDRIGDAVVAVARANERMSGALRVVSLEVHGTSFPGADLRSAAKALPGVQIHIEPRMPDHAWARNAPAVLRLLRHLLPEARIGLKVRCSGGTAVSAATLGWLIPELIALGHPVKATAGLHHPLLETRYGNALGFVGLAAALRLRQGLGEAFTLDVMQRCITESEPAAFSFDGELSWRGHSIGLDALRDAKARLPFAIGSCSLREPDADLERLFGPPRRA